MKKFLTLRHSGPAKTLVAFAALSLLTGASPAPIPGAASAPIPGAASTPTSGDVEADACHESMEGDETVKDKRNQQRARLIRGMI